MTVDPGQELPPPEPWRSWNKPIGGTVIGCAICLYVSGRHVEASTIIRGYAVCADHVVDLSGEFSDFGQLVKRVRGGEAV